jgi:hypothetical protein
MNLSAANNHHGLHQELQSCLMHVLTTLILEIIMRAANSITFSLLLLIATSFAQLQAEDWPQFRGTNCAGISLSKHPLATTFSPTKNIAWEADLGDGIGCPVVAAGRVFVSSMLDAKTVALTGFDAKTGKQLWQRSWPTGTLVEIHKTNSQAATTPCADSVHSDSYP